MPSILESRIEPVQQVPGFQIDLMGVAKKADSAKAFSAFATITTFFRGDFVSADIIVDRFEFDPGRFAACSDELNERCRFG